MTQIAVKTTIVFPKGKFEDHYLRVITILEKKITIVCKESLESGLEDELMQCVAEHKSYDDALDAHDEWVIKAKLGEVKFPDA